MKKKKCIHCGKSRPLSAFYRDSQLTDGHKNKCKACSISYQRKYRVVHIVRDRERDRDYKRRRAPYTVRWTPIIKERQHRWRIANPQKYAARNAVSAAVQTGKLTRAPCEVCGAKAQAHHDDYSKPLEVRWLCRAHHSKEHSKIKT